jgi:hypothetical protein
MTGCASNTFHRFSDDVASINPHAKVVVLRDGNARVATSPQLMGRVMTATYGGDTGPSLGYINQANIAKGDTDPVFNNHGGADRFWLGPEGGQFSIYFEKGKEQVFANWVVPKAIDSGGMVVTSQSDGQVTLQRDIKLTNYSSTNIALLAQRAIRLVSKASAESALGVDLAKAEFVGYESINKITNSGDKPLDRQSGAVSIWVLGMFIPSPGTVIIAPYNRQAEGPIVNDEYFGKVPADRLKILEDAGAVLFKADGKCRSKIGLSPARARNILGSVDFGNNILTICQFSKPADAKDYVNSMWTANQENPFAGDVSNAYNDDGKLGGFYELETSSPAAFLKPGESLTHTHSTLHIHAPMSVLKQIAMKMLGVDLDEVKKLML